jgi:hypothetical protein
MTLYLRLAEKKAAIKILYHHSILKKEMMFTYQK